MNVATTLQSNPTVANPGLSMQGAICNNRRYINR